MSNQKTSEYEIFEELIEYMYSIDFEKFLNLNQVEKKYYKLVTYLNITKLQLE